MAKNIRQEILEVRADFYKYCDRNLWIIDNDFRLVRLKPKRVQRVIIDHVIKCLLEGKPIRAIVLKARKEGLSTIIEALIYWWTATHKYVKSEIIAHESKASNTIYQMFQTFYDNSDPIFKPATKYRTKLALTFDNKDGTGLKSDIATSTADSVNTGRSQTIQWLHGSEVSTWLQGEKLVAGLLQAIPLKANTAIFLESTANGAAGYFYKEWLSAKHGKSAYTPFFFPWYDEPEYRLPTEPLDDLTEEEEEWKRIYKIDDGQIAWYRQKSKEFLHDPALMKQEYPFNDIEAFLASGRPRFQIEKLVEMEQSIREPEYLDIFEKDEEIIVKPLPGAPLKVWQRPQENRKYTIGVDTAEGLEKGDLSVIDVMDPVSVQTVARWRGQAEPSELGLLVYQIASWYNRALVGVEVNNHGLTVIQRLRDMRYDNLYRRERGFDERLESPTAKLGWRTDAKTKPLMIDALAEAINTGKLKDPDEVFIDEAKTYIITARGKTEAQSGAYDDTIMAKAINMQMFDWTKPLLGRREKKSYYPPKMLAKKQRHRKLVKRLNKL